MSHQTIRIETDARGIATLWLARPDKHNALSAQMIDELTEAAGRLGADTGVRAVILAAEGKSFCAGGDLAWMQEQMTADAATRSAGVDRSTPTRGREPAGTPGRSGIPHTGTATGGSNPFPVSRTVSAVA